MRSRSASNRAAALPAAGQGDFSADDARGGALSTIGLLSCLFTLLGFGSLSGVICISCCPRWLGSDASGSHLCCFCRRSDPWHPLLCLRFDATLAPALSGVGPQAAIRSTSWISSWRTLMSSLLRACVAARPAPRPERQVPGLPCIHAATNIRGICSSMISLMVLISSWLIPSAAASPGARPPQTPASAASGRRSGLEASAPGIDIATIGWEVNLCGMHCKASCNLDP
mmetsp:Transcript_54427/g.96521  ORF Transcript_54427/g.96521 Transcript_54427/m.96521 type:complete len:228 (+) Transcript_54427:95-778(+)